MNKSHRRTDTKEAWAVSARYRAKKKQGMSEKTKEKTATTTTERPAAHAPRPRLEAGSASGTCFRTPRRCTSPCPPQFPWCCTPSTASPRRAAQRANETPNERRKPSVSHRRAQKQKKGKNKQNKAAHKHVQHTTRETKETQGTVYLVKRTNPAMLIVLPSTWTIFQHQTQQARTYDSGRHTDGRSEANNQGPIETEVRGTMLHMQLLRGYDIHHNVRVPVHTCHKASAGSGNHNKLRYHTLRFSFVYLSMYRTVGILRRGERHARTVTDGSRMCVRAQNTTI